MSDFLFARPSVMEGIARNADLYGLLNVYNQSENGTQADQTAIMMDWIAVYKDLYEAYKDLVCQIETKKNGA
jgi:hypothetical protein